LFSIVSKEREKAVTLEQKEIGDGFADLKALKGHVKWTVFYLHGHLLWYLT
jgi:hypothetical protein